MGHLCIEPMSLPHSVKQQIDNDVRTYYRKQGRYTSQFHELKPHVPVKRRSGEYTIDYSGLGGQRTNKIMARQVPGDKMLWKIDNLLSDEECLDMISRANNIRNDDKGNRSWHRPGTGGQYMRVIMIDRNLADDLWNRIKDILPKTVSLNGHEVSPSFQIWWAV